MRYFLLSFVLIAACQQPPSNSPPMTQKNVEMGESLAKQHCAGCHAIGRSDVSPHPEAPAFRDLAQSYPPEALAESLSEGIMTGHPDMPVFVFGENETDALVAYLKSIQAPLRI
jgi:cytochrome c